MVLRRSLCDCAVAPAAVKHGRVSYPPHPSSVGFSPRSATSRARLAQPACAWCAPPAHRSACGGAPDAVINYVRCCIADLSHRLPTSRTFLTTSTSPGSRSFHCDAQVLRDPHLPTTNSTGASRGRREHDSSLLSLLAPVQILSHLLRQRTHIIPDRPRTREDRTAGSFPNARKSLCVGGFLRNPRAEISTGRPGFEIWSAANLRRFEIL